MIPSHTPIPKEEEKERRCSMVKAVIAGADGRGGRALLLDGEGGDVQQVRVEEEEERRGGPLAGEKDNERAAARLHHAAARLHHAAPPMSRRTPNAPPPTSV
jgi:hypothetical protein